MQGVGGDVDGTDTVARDGQQPAPDQSLADLDLLGRDAIRRGEPAEHARHHDGQRAAEAPPRAVAAGRTRDDQADQRRPGAQQLLDGMDHEHPGGQPSPAVRLACRGHVASPGSPWVPSVSSSTRRCAVSRSRLWILIGPAADAVVTVTFASPKTCSNGPRSLSTVWMRETGAMRRSWLNQPDWV